MRKLWSALSKATKKKYQRQGVTPQRYNAWNRKSAAERRKLDRDLYLTMPARGQKLAPTKQRVKLVARIFDDLKAIGVRYVSASTLQRNIMRVGPTKFSHMEFADAITWRILAAGDTDFHYR